MLNSNKQCGCKGIRTCLVCENKSQNCEEECEANLLSYTYCHRCNLCWPIKTYLSGQGPEVPILLEGIYLVPEFISSEEEKSAIAEIDSFPWFVSQSGRRKQDFGPKVNFKKRKVKLDSFKGFPRFALRLAQKLEEIDTLSDFKPVELCHLEYSPNRGSAIDPHLDDFWLWGERLVTINLSSETVLTLTPTLNLNSDLECDCSNISRFSNVFGNSASNGSVCEEKCEETTLLNGACRSSSPSNGTHHANLADLKICDHHQSWDYESRWNRAEKDSEHKLEIRIDMPPRSLLVLSKCARHHWYHQIKRKDIFSRRIAMTYRELSEQFLDGGEQWETVGKELLSIARRTID